MMTDWTFKAPSRLLRHITPHDACLTYLLAVVALALNGQKRERDNDGNMMMMFDNRLTDSLVLPLLFSIR